MRPIVFLDGGALFVTRYVSMVIPELNETKFYGLQYQRLDRLRKDYPGVPIMALTATADASAISDIKNILSIENCVTLRQSFNRANLYYEVLPKPGKMPVAVAAIASYIEEEHAEETGIIYALSRKNCEDIAAMLRTKHAMSADYYHALLTPDAKREVQAKWQSGLTKIIVSTVEAFRLLRDYTKLSVKKTRSLLAWALIKRMFAL